MMQTPTASYPGGAVPSSKKAVHSVPIVAQAGSVRSQNAPQHEAPLHEGSVVASRHTLPAAQSLMNPHGSPAGMSRVVKMQLKLPFAQKHASPRPQSCRIGLQL